MKPEDRIKYIQMIDNVIPLATKLGFRSRIFPDYSSITFTLGEEDNIRTPEYWDRTCITIYESSFTNKIIVYLDIYESNFETIEEIKTCITDLKKSKIIMKKLKEIERIFNGS